MTQRVDKDSLPLDKPRRTPGHPTKSHIVKTKVDGKEKIIRFGEQGAKTAGKPKAGESERMKAKRASFKARHAKNIAKGKSSPAYWANRVKWAEGGPVELREMYAKYNEGYAEGGKVSTYKRLTDTLSKMVSLDTPQEMTAGETVADIAAGFVPGVGTAQAARDFERARREGDRLGMGLAGAGMIPVVGGMVKPGKAAAKSLGELVDHYVRKVRRMDELGPATLSVHRVEAPVSAEVPGWHITQDLPGILETGAMTNKAVGDQNMQGWVPAHVGGAYFYSDPRLARAKWEDLAEMLGGDRALAAEMPIIRAQLRRGNRLVPDEDVGLEIPWHQSYQEGSFATTRPVLINQIDRIYSADPGITKDMIRDTVVRQRRYAEGGAVEASAYDPAKIEAIISGINQPGFAAGGAVSTYDPTVVDALAAKYDDGGAVSVEQQLRDAEMRMRMEAATPLERQTYETLGMEPGLDRATLLPIAGSRSGGNLQLAVPGFIYDIGKALMTPGAAARGVPLSYDDVVNMAGNTMGGGLAISSPVEGAVAGMAIKRKGGNWLDMSIADEIAPLRSRVLGQDPARRLEEIEAAYAQNSQAGIPTDETFMQRERERLMPDIAVNRWLDTKLNKYIRNEMGTPEDPVRALAERGVLHTQPRWLGPQATNELRAIREMEGFPGAGLGQSELARRWEDVADSVIEPRQARDFLATRNFAEGELGGLPTTERYPWLLKVPPETKVYDLAAGNNMRDLGFDHLVDELNNAMDPNSPLPSNLRIDPKDIDKITVPQAVERVARINDWRAQEAIRAERAGMMANLQAAPRVEVPEFALSFTEQPGGRWVDIPETVDEKGMTLCTSIGKAGGWCTQGQGLAQSYGSGSNRLVALVDAEGRPHAQAKLTSDFDEMSAFDYVLDALTPEQETAFGDFSDAFDRPLELDEALAWMEEEAPDAYIKYQDALNKKADSVPDITEMKPPGNTFDSDRAREYAKRDPQYKGKVTESALKFLNSGEWGRVNQEDLKMFGIVDLNDTSSVLRYLDDIYYGSENANDAEMIFNLATDAATMDTPRFMDRGQFINFLEPYEPMPSEGFAKGGAVRAYDKSKIDELVSKFGTPGFAAGGAVKNYNAAAVDALVNKVLEGNYV